GATFSGAEKRPRPRGRPLRAELFLEQARVIAIDRQLQKRLPPEVQRHAWKVIGVLRTPAPVELNELGVDRAPRNQLTLRPRLGVVTRVHAPDIGVCARGEAQVRSVIPRVARSGKLQVQPPPRAVQFREISKTIPRAVQISIGLRVIEGPP